MTDFATARRMMVDGQVRTADVTDRSLLAAMLEVPRELFVPERLAALAYLDNDVVVEEAPDRRDRRSLLKPMVLAKLLQAAEVGAEDVVLDVGCATGYSSAVLSRLAGTVVALEQDAGLAAEAGRVLRDSGAANVTVVQGALAAGWPVRAPYDLIVINGAVELLPPDLIRQIKDGGRLVCVMGFGPAGKAMLYRSSGGDVSGRPIFDAFGPPLPGFSKPAAFVF